MRISKPNIVVLRPVRIEQLLGAKYPGVWPGLAQTAIDNYDGAVRAVATSVLGPLSGRILSGEFGDPFEGEDDDEDIDLLSDAKARKVPAAPIPDAAIEAARTFLDQLLSDYNKLQTASNTELEEQVAALRATATQVARQSPPDVAVDDELKVDQRYLKTLYTVLRACLIDGYGYRDDGHPDATASNLEVRKLVYAATLSGRGYEGGDGKRDTDRKWRAISRAITDAVLKGRQ